MVKEREKEQSQGNSGDVTQPQFPLSSLFGISFKYMGAKYTQRGTLCCEVAQILVNYVNKIIYQGANTTLGTAGSVCECLPGPRSTWAAAQGEQQTDWVVAVVGR